MSQKVYVLHYQTEDSDDGTTTDVIEVFSSKKYAIEHAETLIDEAAEDDDITSDAMHDLRKEGAAVFERYGIAHGVWVIEKEIHRGI